MKLQVHYDGDGFVTRFAPVGYSDRKAVEALRWRVGDVTVYPYQEVEALRKKGRLDEAYRKAKELFRDHKDDGYLKNSFGWVLYHKIKAIAEKAARNGVPKAHRTVASQAALRQY